MNLFSWFGRSKAASPSLATEPAKPSGRCKKCGLNPDEHVGCDLDACVVHEVRGAAKRVTGGNMTFVADDVMMLEHLAVRAVLAGLVDGLHPTVAAKAVEAVKSHEMAATYGVSAAQNDPPGKARAKRSRPNQKPAEGEG